MSEKMSPEAHKARHVELHKMLDELVADFIGHTGNLPSKTSLRELMQWAYEQTISPTEEGGLTQRALDGAESPQNLEGLTVEYVPDDGAGNPTPRK